MQNHFSFRRFSMLFQKHTSEHIKSYLMSLGVLLGILALFIGGAAYAEDNPLTEMVQKVFFVLFLFGVGTVFTSGVFANLGDKNKSIAFLTLPASHLEKFLVGWLYSFLLFVLVYIACFYLVDYVVLSMEAGGAEPRLLNVFSVDEGMYEAILYYAFLHSLAIWGSTFFQKGHFIKTAFAFIVVMGILLVLNEQIMQLVWAREINGAMPFANISFNEGEELAKVALPEAQQSILSFIPMVLAALFWAASYKLLQEKQV